MKLQAVWRHYLKKKSRSDDANAGDKAKTGKIKSLWQRALKFHSKAKYTLAVHYLHKNFQSLQHIFHFRRQFWAAPRTTNLGLVKQAQNGPILTSGFKASKPNEMSSKGALWRSKLEHHSSKDARDLMNRVTWKENFLIATRFGRR